MCFIYSSRGVCTLAGAFIIIIIIIDSLFVFLVVQLFNAVNKQQKELESKLTEVGSSEAKRQKGKSTRVCQFVYVFVQRLCVSMYV